MIDLIRAAQSSGVSAKYVLFDSWFSSPKTITALKTNCGLDTIAMVKKSSKIKYGYQGGRYSIKEIYKQCRKRRGRSKYLLSIDVTVGDEAIEAKSSVSGTKARKKTGLPLSVQTQRFQKKKSSVFMGNAGILRCFSRPANPIYIWQKSAGACPMTL